MLFLFLLYLFQVLLLSLSFLLLLILYGLNPNLLDLEFDPPKLYNVMLSELIV